MKLQDERRSDYEIPARTLIRHFYHWNCLPVDQDGEEEEEKKLERKEEEKGSENLIVSVNRTRNVNNKRRKREKPPFGMNYSNEKKIHYIPRE